nr:cytochrome c oxidase subunit 2 [Osculotes curta]
MAYNIRKKFPVKPFFYSYLLQDSSSVLMSFISHFHDHVMMVVLVVLSIISYVMIMIFFFPCFGRFLKSSESLEGLWTVLPCLVLASLAAPSLMTLYLSDEVSSPVFSIKIVGHQWYWTYEYGDIMMSYDSYLVPTNDLKVGDFRLLEVDKSIFLPLDSETRLLVTSSDVIHSWTIPSMGVKMDAIPGRLNQFFILPYRSGKMYGQCSEICGSMHSYMPICVEVVPLEILLKTLKKISA